VNAESIPLSDDGVADVTKGALVPARRLSAGKPDGYAP
jgi:hypothetical protein